jgi:hypothetical protein
MGDFPGDGWFERYRARVNADPELAVIGDWFTTTFGLAFGDRRYAVQVERGRMIEVFDTPRLDVRVPFGFRAPVDVWRKFLSADPPPLFHDFFAMLMRVPDFVLEGDSLLAMQNARALHRMMNIMRETGAPDA